MTHLNQSRIAPCNSIRTPLHYAAYFKQPSIILALKSAGANSDAEDQYGHTPFDEIQNQPGEVYNMLKPAKSAPSIPPEASVEQDSPETVCHLISPIFS